MFDFDNTYADLPGGFSVRLDPTPVASPQLIRINSELAKQLGLDTERLASADGIATLAGNLVPDGAEPIATAYAGHQFGRFVPQLGDGRAVLLGEIVGRDDDRYDIQLKGSGPTPFSRSGDGRAALGPVLREYIISEAMAALGIPTTRALAAVATGEYVYRESALPGAVLTRVAKGLVRVGTFQYFAVRRDIDGIRALADYTIARHYPDAGQAANPIRALLDAVVAAQAGLIAQWMHVGFIHGVMNTDNMSIAGETIDYGPCAFIDTFHPGTVYSSIDYAGRYAYSNQPHIAQWNLAQFAQCLIPVLADDDSLALTQAQESIDAFPELYRVAWLKGMRRKLGLLDELPGDQEIAESLLTVMTDDKLDFTNTFRRLRDLTVAAPADDTLSLGQVASEASINWLAKWRLRLAEESTSQIERTATMNAANPAFIPRNHRVEEALRAAEAGELQLFQKLNQVLSRPYDDQPEFAAYSEPPRPDQVVQATFCGT